MPYPRFLAVAESGGKTASGLLHQQVVDKNMQLSWLIRSSSSPRLEKALPVGAWAWAAAYTSRRRSCSAACSTKAAWFTRQWPITTSPEWFSSRS